MDILLAIIQLLFTSLNENLDRLEQLRQRRDLDDPVIIPPMEPVVDIVEEPAVTPEREIEIVETKTPVIDSAMDSTEKSRETPGLTSTETATGTDLNINLYSEPLCGTGLYKVPALVKDILLTISVLINLYHLAVYIKKAIALRRRRQQAAQNHPINRPILGQVGKFLDSFSKYHLLPIANLIKY